jgi:dTDP-4-dehydrorhamnose 3,5-epimerase
MRVKSTELDNVLEILPPTNFEDFRGSYVELYNERLYCEAGIAQEFIQDDISMSRRNVLRGIHGDQTTTKLVTCLHGAFYLVVVNNDPNSQQYRKWQGFILSAERPTQILIPPKFGNGHLVLTESAIFHYKQTTEYDRSGQFTILWNDPDFDIWWPVRDPMLSLRDSGKLS